MTILNPQETSHEELTPTEEKAIEIMLGNVAPTNHYEQQIFLSAQIYHEQNSDVVFEPHIPEERKAIWEYWQTHGYSDAFREIREHSDFSSNKILKGDPTKITLEHLTHWKLTGQLPE